MNERWLFAGLWAAGTAFMFVHGFRQERWGFGSFGLACLLMLVRGLWQGEAEVDRTRLFDRRMMRDKLQTVTRERNRGAFWYAMFGRAVGALVFSWLCWSDFFWK
ncbi:MAG TPA: hypothetical protein VH105_23050 [Burkholderiales bacterium]|nr:hypothetical protein [Burkholderiales bacterium]